MSPFRALLSVATLSFGLTAFAATPEVRLFENLRTKAIENLPFVASPNFARSSRFDDATAGRMLGLNRAELNHVFAQLRADHAAESREQIEDRLATEAAVLLLDRVLRGTNFEHLSSTSFYPRFEVREPEAMQTELRANALMLMNLDAEQMRDPRQVQTLTENAQLFELAADRLGRLAQTSITAQITHGLRAVAAEVRAAARDLARRSFVDARETDPSLLEHSLGSDDEAAAVMFGIGTDEWREVMARAAERSAPNLRQYTLAVETGERLIKLLLSPNRFKFPTRRYRFYDRFKPSFDISPRLREAALHALQLSEVAGRAGLFNANEAPPTLEQYERVVGALERLHSIERSHFQTVADRVLTQVLADISPLAFGIEPPADAGARSNAMTSRIKADFEAFTRQIDALIVARVHARKNATLIAVVDQLVRDGIIHSDRKPRRRLGWLTPRPAPASAAEADTDTLNVDAIINEQWQQRGGHTSERARLRMNGVVELIRAVITDECARRMSNSTSTVARSQARVIKTLDRALRREPKP